MREWGGVSTISRGSTLGTFFYVCRNLIDREQLSYREMDALFNMMLHPNDGRSMRFFSLELRDMLEMHLWEVRALISLFCGPWSEHAESLTLVCFPFVLTTTREGTSNLTLQIYNTQLIEGRMRVNQSFECFKLLRKEDTPDVKIAVLYMCDCDLVVADNACCALLRDRETKGFLREEKESLEVLNTAAGIFNPMLTRYVFLQVSEVEPMTKHRKKVVSGQKRVERLKKKDQYMLLETATHYVAVLILPKGVSDLKMIGREMSPDNSTCAVYIRRSISQSITEDSKKTVIVVPRGCDYRTIKVQWSAKRGLIFVNFPKIGHSVVHDIYAVK